MRLVLITTLLTLALYFYGVFGDTQDPRGAGRSDGGPSVSRNDASVSMRVAI
jgi:hypothetical protein